MLGQVALLRELAVASFGIELVFLAGTAAWLLAGAAGALAPPGHDPLGRSRVLFLAAAAVLPAEAAFLRGARLIFGGVPGAYLPLWQELATVALGLMPAGAVLGWLFRCGARAMASQAGSLVAAYGWESLGGAAGCATATASLAAGTSNLTLVLVAALSAALAGAVASRPGRPVALALVAALLMALAVAPALDLHMTGWTHPSLALSEDTPYGRIVLTEAQGQLTVFENDALTWESEGTEAEALVHPAALEVGPGARVLVLEGGLHGIAEELLKHRPARLDLVELNEAMARALLPRLPQSGRAALADPVVHLVVADPRTFVAAGSDPYDLIVIGAGEPSSGQVNRLYTAELFRRCAARLAAGGVLALRLPSLENLWTPGLLLRNAAVHAALRKAFRDVLVLPGSTDVLLASQETLERDPAELSMRLRSRGIASREITPESLRYLLTNDRVATAARLLAGAGAAPNSDDRPVCYQQTALIWLAKLLGGAREAHLPARGTVLGVLLAIAALTAAARGWPRVRPWALVAAASFAAVALEAAVILRYQTWSGALFRDLGVLLTSFMLGLAAGARFAARSASMPPRRASGLGPLLALTLLSTGFAFAGRAGVGWGLAVGSATLAAAGAALAVVFGRASRMMSGTRDLAGPLYGADLVGGCLGSLLAGGLLVPVLGLDGTALGIAGVAAATAMLAV